LVKPTSLRADPLDGRGEAENVPGSFSSLMKLNLEPFVCGAVITGATLFGEQKFAPSMWLFLGAACYAVYHFRSTKFTIVPTDKGNLLVIDDADGATIIKELETRRAAQYRSEYDFMPEGDTPDQHRSRFKWLHREGALSDEELQQRLAVVDARDASRMEAVAPIPGVMLN